MKRWLATLGLVAITTAAAAGPPPPGNALRAGLARNATLELSLDDAKKTLEGADAADAALALERARVALYEGRCGEAAALLARPDLQEHEAAAGVLAVSRGCERAAAGAVVVEDAGAGAWIRFQDGADAALAPYLVEVVASTRAVFQRDLGVEMPRPIRVEVVRDQLALSMMTGLPLEAARTTGTIGVAKWGRVIVVSPRATPKGYAYLDTLAHELTHLALTRGSRDRAPLWLQEGVARIEETRWRDALPFDDVPSADALAAHGLQRGIGPDIDRIGPSIALLPSATEAQITYAKVMSFMRFYGREAGDEAMPRLLVGLRDVDDPDDVPKIVESVTGQSFASWHDRWRAAVLAGKHDLPEDLRPGAPPSPHLKEVRKRVRLGELLLAREHHEAAARELDPAVERAPREPVVRALAARAREGAGRTELARTLVEAPADVSSSDARWWAMRARLVSEDAARAVRAAIAQSPYDPLGACLDTPGAPLDDARGALCEAARQKPVAR